MTKKTCDKQILVVEDEKPIQTFQAQFLTRSGYGVLCANNGRDALEKLKTCRPDLIVLDLVMPEMDGFEFLQAIRNNSDYKDIPVIIFSNLGQASDRIRVEKYGVDSYLIKVDTSLDRLIGEINVAVNKKDEPKKEDKAS